jgi:hypothetical protein
MVCKLLATPFRYVVKETLLWNCAQARIHLPGTGIAFHAFAFTFFLCIEDVISFIALSMDILFTTSGFVVVEIEIEVCPTHLSEWRLRP